MCVTWYKVKRTTAKITTAISIEIMSAHGFQAIYNKISRYWYNISLGLLEMPLFAVGFEPSDLYNLCLEILGAEVSDGEKVTPWLDFAW